MEEGDLMDRIPVLLTRDRQYYDVSILGDEISYGITEDFLIPATSNRFTRSYLPWCCWWNLRFSKISFVCIRQSSRMVKNILFHERNSTEVSHLAGGKMNTMRRIKLIQDFCI